MSAAPAAAPSGVVTFHFTDIEGSTRRWEADADAMRAALGAHDEVLRHAIRAHGGFLFKHTGDGICAAFASPRSGVDAAIAAQHHLELPVRIGLATGEAELREADYFGAVLNRAARVMTAGHGGQILVAESMAGLLSGVDLVDLGASSSATPAKLSDTTELGPPVALQAGHHVIPITASTPTTFVLFWISTGGTTGGRSHSDIAELTLQTAVQLR